MIVLFGKVILSLCFALFFIQGFLSFKEWYDIYGTFPTNIKRALPVMGFVFIFILVGWLIMMFASFTVVLR